MFHRRHGKIKNPQFRHRLTGSIPLHASYGNILGRLLFFNDIPDI